MFQTLAYLLSSLLRLTMGLSVSFLALSDLTNAIKIRRGKETAVFRTNRNEDKKILLSAFRQVAEGLAEQKRKNIEREQERRRSLWQGDSAASPATRPSKLRDIIF